jgi:hypothetical protein
MSVKLKISVPDRLRLLDVLAGEDITGKRSRFKLLNKLECNLSIGVEEGERIGFFEEKLPDGRIRSGLKDPSKDPMKEIEVDDVFLEIICNKLKSAEDAGQLKRHLVGLYDIFYPEIVKMSSPEEMKRK